MTQDRERQPSFTPGPWLVADEREMAGEFWIVVDHSDVGHVSIAGVRHGCDEAAELGSEEANARLIAASPCMFEALSNLYDEIVAGRSDADLIIYYGDSDLLHAISRAREVIAKAKGTEAPHDLT